MKLRITVSAIPEDPDAGSTVEIPILATADSDLDLRDSDVLNEETALAIINEIIDRMNHRLSEAEISLGGNLQRPFPWLKRCGHCHRIVDSRTEAEHSHLA